jgi:CheY-like chemotaxis protein
MLTLNSRSMPAEALSAAAEILLLADKDQDVLLVRGAAHTNNINVVPGCPQVLSFLRREQGYGDCPRPDLILLDLDLSNPEDCDTLREIKEDTAFRRIPVIVLAANDTHAVIQDAYNLHANAYIVKPKEPEEFVRVVKATLSFWLKLARLPND